MDGRIQYLRKRDLVAALGVPKSTVSDWINEFAAFVPSRREDGVTFYRSETIEVLQAIQTHRTAGHNKAAVVRLLADQGFALNEDHYSVSLTVGDPSTQVLATLSLAMATLAGQGGKIEALEREIAELREQLALAKETPRRKWWPWRS